MKTIANFYHKSPGSKFTKLLTQILKIFPTLGLKILRLLTVKEVFDADINKD